MKRTLIALAATGLLACGAATAANAAGDRHDSTLAPVQYHGDDHSQNVGERASQIDERIDRGQHDGRITDREARQLHRQLQDVQAKERRFDSNGRMSARESEELNRDLDRIDNEVRRQSHDEQRR